MYSIISLYSYGLATLAYTTLGVAMLLVWRNRSLSLTAIVATTFTAIWAATVAISSLLPHPPVGLIKLVEIIRNASWIFLLLSIYGGRLRGSQHPLSYRGWLPWFVVGLTFIGITLYAGPALISSHYISPDFANLMTHTVGLAMTVIAMLLVENIYRNSSEAALWRLKYLCMGLGFLFLYDFFMYAGALILRDLDPVLWQSRGFAVALTAPLIGLAAARSQDRRSNEKLSRHVTFHTFTLLATGLYLISTAVLGYYIEALGGSWSGVLQVVFISAAGLLLAALLFSSRARAFSRVWLSKNFFSYKYDYRREWMDFTSTLVEEGENTPLAVIKAMAKLGHSRAGLLWVKRDDQGFRFAECWQVPPPDITGDFAEFTQWLERTGWVIDVREWLDSPGVYANLKMPEELAHAPGDWMVVPLLFKERLEGFLLLLRSAKYERLNWEDRDLLKVAAREAASRLTQYYTNNALIELRQFEAHSRLSAYVVHDLKNILTQQSLIVSNAARHRGNLAFFDQVIETIENSVERMSRLMMQMQSGTRGENPKVVELGELLSEVVALRSRQAPKPVLHPPAMQQWVYADREQLATIFGHIVQNAREAIDKRGRVDVRLSHENGRALVEVEDDGTGMSDEFIRNRLFKPFDSTKGLTGMGVGAYESREYVRSLGGEIQVSSTEGHGSCFRIVIPCVDPQNLPQEPNPEVASA